MWWITISLILVGILFMLIELLLVPGVGVAGIFSFASLVTSCWYTFSHIGNSAGWWVTVAVLVLLVIMLIVILRAKTWKRFELNTEVASKVNEESSLVNVGDKGIARTRLAPIGTGIFGSVQCEVKSEDNSMIDAGTDIEVVKIRDNQVIIKKI